MAVGNPILAIIGPTACGKSELAMAIARRTGAEILSVDSMQVYRGMDIGTAKPSRDEQHEIRHHLLDLVEPTESFAVARFVELADAVIADAAARGRRLIAVGGTPLYFKSLFHGMFDGPGADADLRNRLRALGGEELHARLAAADPQAAARIHPNDIRRLVRALEVHELTGRPISSLQRQWADPPARHAAVWVGPRRDTPDLNRRINARTRAMIAAGWVEETRALLARHGSLGPTASMAAGYAQLIDHLRGRIGLDDAIEQIKIATRQLARRQNKWFRRFEPVHWLDGNTDMQAGIAAVLDIWP